MARRRVSLFLITTIGCLLLLAYSLRSGWRADSIYLARAGHWASLDVARGAVSFTLAADPDRVDQFIFRSKPPQPRFNDLAMFPNDFRAHGWAWSCLGYGIGGWWEQPSNGGASLWMIRLPLAFPIAALAIPGAWLFRRDLRRNRPHPGFPLSPSSPLHTKPPPLQ